MSDTPKVSIIIACFNAAPYLRSCLNSLLSQTYQDFEILICDDASTDNSFAIINEYILKDKRIRVFKNEENMYAAFSRNICIKNANGNYIVIQDADDISSPDRIEKLVSFLENNTEYDFVSSNIVAFKDENEINYNLHVRNAKPRIPQKKDFLFQLPFYHAATAFRIDCLKKVNMYRVSNETRRGQDYDLFMRLYAAGFKGYNIDDVLYFYRMDYLTLKRRTFKAKMQECIIRYKGFKMLGLLPQGLPYVIKPIVAFIVQTFKDKKTI